MILLLRGEDSYRSRTKLRSICQAYLEKPGAELNFIRLATPFTEDEFENAVFSAPFLSRSRLVVVEDLLGTKSSLAERVTARLEGIPASTIIIFYESLVPDGRLKPFQIVKKIAKSEEFPLLQGRALSDWVKRRAAELDSQISPRVTELLVRAVGPDLWRMDMEIQKLIAYNPEITAESVELLVKSEQIGDIFALVDAIGEKRRPQALQIAHLLLSTGGTEFYLLTMIARQLRNIMLAKDLMERKFQVKLIAEKVGLHPFVAEKACKQAANFDMQSLRSMYEEILAADLRLKNTGAEPALELDLLISRLCET
jgi:DNA polymerase-3 subunit delta